MDILAQLEDKMQRTLWLASLIILALFFLSSLVSAQPKMSISEDYFDFGYVPQESNLSHTFWIKSVGTDTLKIIDIKPG